MKIKYKPPAFENFFRSRFFTSPTIEYSPAALARAKISTLNPRANSGANR
ncbi:MAG: hypothetical protein GY757_04535 [bacterium]|nr:hypothetical protein [bacterium]